MKLKNAGFTLLEMLVVIMIMGFLLASIAPRFANIFGDSEDTVCDSNIRNTRQFVAGFEMVNNKLPNDLLNPCLLDNEGNWSGPAVGDPVEDGVECFPAAFVERVTAGLYELNAAEAAELASYGVSEIYAYNSDGDASDTANSITKSDLFGGGNTLDIANLGRYLQKVPVEAGVKVLMIGASTNSSNAVTNEVVVNDATNGLSKRALTTADLISHPQWMYRIFLGISPDSELVTSGYAQASGLCPSFERGVSEYTTWGYYCLVLPRLSATMDRVSGTTGLIQTVKCIDSGADDPDRAQEVVVDTLDDEAIECSRAGFDVFCPEGHRWPELVEAWEITEITAVP